MSRAGMYAIMVCYIKRKLLNSTCTGESQLSQKKLHHKLVGSEQHNLLINERINEWMNEWISKNEWMIDIMQWKNQSINQLFLNHTCE